MSVKLSTSIMNLFLSEFKTLNRGTLFNLALLFCIFRSLMVTKSYFLAHKITYKLFSRFKEFLFNFFKMFSSTFRLHLLSDDHQAVASTFIPPKSQTVKVEGQNFSQVYIICNCVDKCCHSFLCSFSYRVLYFSELIELI